MRTTLDEPAPLNPHAEFPHRISPFPLDWLLKFTSLGQISDPPATPSHPKNPTSLESWT